MDSVEELRRVVRGYRQKPPRRSSPALLDAITELDTELGPGRNQHLPAGGGSLEQELRAVASRLVREGGVSNVAGTLLHGILGQIESPGRRAAVIDAQPNHAGQLPEPVPAGFPSPT